jgi:hypothetical protein
MGINKTNHSLQENIYIIIVTSDISILSAMEMCA